MSESLTASIIGPTKHSIRVGSRVTLTCLVRFGGSSDYAEFHYLSYEKPVLWFHFWKWLSVQVQYNIYRIQAYIFISEGNNMRVGFTIHIPSSNDKFKI